MEEKKYTTYELIEDQKGNLNIAIFLEDAYTLEEQAYIKNIEPERFIDMENDIENWRSWREWKKAKIAKRIIKYTELELAKID